MAHSCSFLSVTELQYTPTGHTSRCRLYESKRHSRTAGNSRSLETQVDELRVRQPSE